MQKDLVSIISPCYNGEKYVCNFLDSVLKQTYNHVELIVVNDGSVDGTEKILKSYEKKFKERGYSYVYCKQENKGQAAAINTGLGKYSGEYLMWVDSDDILLPQNVEKKVEFLQKNIEYGFVICEGELVNSNDLNTVIGSMCRKKPKGKDNLFSDLIFEHNVVFGPGVIMARRTAIEKAIPENKIFESREGQNWQLILPLAYSYKCGYIEEVHFYCVAHDDSHSRTERSYEERIKRNDNFVVLLTETIRRLVDMPNKEKQKWISKVYIKHSIKKMEIAKRNKKRQDYKCIKNELNTYVKEYHMQLFYFAYVLRNKVSIIRRIYSKIKKYFLKIQK